MATKAVQEYRECAKLPVLKDACILRSSNASSCDVIIASYWTQRDLERGEKRTFLRTHHCSVCPKTSTVQDVQPFGFAEECHGTQKSQWSPSGKLRALVRQIPATNKTEEKQFIEVWDRCHCIASIDVKSKDQHGKIYEDGQFGSLSWSPDESCLLYVAEKKTPKSSSFFEPPKSQDKNEDKKAEDTRQGEQNIWYQEWGEQLMGKINPVLCTVCVATGNVKVLDTPEHLTVGQSIWAPDGKSVVFVGWENEPYRLGLMYCTNRRSAIYSLSLESEECVCLTPGCTVAITPRFNPQGTKLVFLSRDCLGPHLTCMKLMMMSWMEKEVSVVIDAVQEQAGPDVFPGIFSAGEIPGQCWLSDGKRMALSTAWRSSKHIVVINVEEKTVTRITPDEGCHTLLDVQEDLLLASFSTPNAANKLMVMSLAVENPSWTCVDPGLATGNMEKEISWKILNFNSPDTVSQGFSASYDAVFMTPHQDTNKASKFPLIVFIHGGPHAFFPADFNLYTSCFCRLGFAVLGVNYRGSIGFGDKLLMTLPGRIGTQDVQDVQFAVSKVLQDYSDILDVENVLVTGGSHGGFLTAHLIGQYPCFYKAACLRNPVINLTTMLGTTDIPDWVWFESGVDFKYDAIPSPEVLQRMIEKSPITHAGKITTPCLIMLGGKDLRVPPSQGKEFYKILKARGTADVRVLMYNEDCHPLNKVSTEADCFVNIINWFQQRRG